MVFFAVNRCRAAAVAVTPHFGDGVEPAATLSPVMVLSLPPHYHQAVGVGQSTVVSPL